MVDITKLTFQDIRTAVLDSDVHRAIRGLQEKAGITDGLIASHHIDEDAWGKQPLAATELMIAQWLLAEDFQMNHRQYPIVCPAMTIVTAAVRNTIIKEGRLPIITVYDHPKDAPDDYVGRIFDGEKPTDHAFATPHLAQLREQMRLLGLTPLPRNRQDDPVIIETWL